MSTRSFTQQELELNERRRLERPLLLMIWVGVMCFSFGPFGGWFYLVIGTIAVGINLLACQRGQEFFVPRVFVNIGVLIASGVLLLELYYVARQSTPLLVAISHYLIWIQLCKLFEKKTNRDYTQMLLLSMLLMMATAITFEAMWFTATMLSYMGLACYTAMIFTLKRGLDKAAGERLTGEQRPLEVHRVAWNIIRDWPGGALRRRLVSVVVSVLAAGALLFVAAPRGEAMATALLSRSPFAATGLSPDVRLGQNRKIVLSDRVVMTVRTSGAPDNSPAFGYLRGMVFNHYEQNRWLRISESRRTGLVIQLPPQERNAAAMDIAMAPSLLPTLCVPGSAVLVKTDEGNVTCNEDLEWRMNRPGNVLPLVRFQVQYWPGPLTDDQRAYLQSRRRALGQGPPAPAIVQATPRVAGLAREWCKDILAARSRDEGGGDRYNQLIAARIRQKLQERCTYTLDLDAVQPRLDGVEDFLFNTKRGHCEYFASAMTVMCASLDVPVRMAGGFRFDAQNRVDDQYVVRECDAHAWTELYTEQDDWVPIDATPAGVQRQGDSWSDQLSGWWRRVEFVWYDRVMGFDAENRTKMWDAVVNWFVGIWTAIVAWFAGLWRAIVRLLATGEVDLVLARLVLALAAAGLGITAFIVGRGVLRYRAEKLRSLLARTDPAEQARQLLAFFNYLRRGGLRTTAGATVRELAQCAASQYNLPAEPLERLAAAYYLCRWGGQMPPETELAYVTQQANDLAVRVQQGRKKVRRGTKDRTRITRITTDYTDRKKP